MSYTPQLVVKNVISFTLWSCLIFRRFMLQLSGKNAVYEPLTRALARLVHPKARAIWIAGDVVIAAYVGVVPPTVFNAFGG